MPQNYLDVERDPEPQPEEGIPSHSPALGQQISFSSVDYTIDDHDAVDPDELLREQENKAELERQQKHQQHQQQEAKRKVQQNQRLDSLATINSSEDDRQYCIAMYDYDATCDEELSFVEGEIVSLLSKEPHDIDDGW